MSEPLSERMEEFEVSLINQPLDDLGSLLNERNRALERARRRWCEAYVICEE